MIKVQIAGIERELSDCPDSWVHEQIKPRQQGGVEVCVRVSVKIGKINIVLSSGECPPSGSGRRRPTTEEARLLKKWNQLRLNQAPIDSECLIKFLKQIESLC